jgi:hypothetical protein
VNDELDKLLAGLPEATVTHNGDWVVMKTADGGEWWYTKEVWADMAERPEAMLAAVDQPGMLFGRPYYTT